MNSAPSGLRASLIGALFVLIPLVVLAEIALLAPRLPEKLATHFAADGNPNGWESRGLFLGIMIGTLIFQFVVFGSIRWLLTRLSDNLINLPNKAYWLAPERRSETFAYLAESMGVFGILTFILFGVANHKVLQFNLGNAAAFQHFAIWIGLYLACIIAWVLRFGLHFRLPRA